MIEQSDVEDDESLVESEVFDGDEDGEVFDDDEDVGDGESSGYLDDESEDGLFGDVIARRQPRADVIAAGIEKKTQRSTGPVECLRRDPTEEGLSDYFIL